MNWKYLAAYTVVVVAISISATKRLWPTVETQLKIEEKEVIKKDVRTVIKERVNTDGSSTKETIIVDNSKESSVKRIEEVKFKKDDWFVAAGAELHFRDLNSPVYRFEANRRILGDFYIGASARTDGTVGLQVGYSF